MPRPRKTIRPVELHIKLPEDLVARLRLELFSEAEGRIPQGAYQALFEQLLRNHFKTTEVEIPSG